MGLGILRLDGFVSLDAAADGGVVTIRPVRLTGDTLCLNAAAGAGEIRVEILKAVRGEALADEVDTPISPFLKDGCVPVAADGARQVVRWRGQPVLRALEDQPVRLRFHMRNAELFSF